MNTKQEIADAIKDYNNGKMGYLQLITHGHQCESKLSQHHDDDLAGLLLESEAESNLFIDDSSFAQS